ncbi:MAG: hypothetical protein JW795_23115 [Chitinivibrionales bacterium]|nr:hypothetical protein [Chitinivibrionales bacterium]
MEHTLADLTQKLYQEGIERAQKEGQEIIDSALKEASKIKNQALKEAEKIIAEATGNCAHLRASTESDIKQSSIHLINTIKQRIADSITASITDSAVKNLFEDRAAVQTLIITALQNWNNKQNNSDGPVSLELILPQKMAKEAHASFEQSLRQTLNATVTLSFSPTLRGGFEIRPVGSRYKITFSDENFITLFKEFLRPKTRAFLFND